MSDQPDPEPYDALLLLSFGGPEGPDDVVPFLQNVTRGRGIPRERLEKWGSTTSSSAASAPSTTRTAPCSTRCERTSRERPRPAGLLGQPQLGALSDRRAGADGRRRCHAASCFATSAYASYSGCRQYRENLAARSPSRRRGARPQVDKLRHYFNHPGFVEPMVDATLAALADLPTTPTGRRTPGLHHPLDPDGDGRHSAAGRRRGAYVAQHLDVARLVADRVAAGDRHRRTPGDLVYQSRSGPPHMPWLEPDVNDHLEELAATGAPAVVLVPIGFVSDHMEVVYDLDTEALRRPRELGLPLARAATVGRRSALRGRGPRAACSSGRRRARRSRCAPRARRARRRPRRVPGRLLPGPRAPRPPLRGRQPVRVSDAP